MEENSSGDSDLKQQYFNAIFAHIPTICSVCKAASGLGFRVWGLGFGVWGLGFRV